MPEQCVFALVLAAGKSSRFGATKQLAEFDGKALVARAVRLAEEVCGERTVLVVGCDWKKVLAASSPLRGFFIRNDSYASGISASIACGVRSIAHSADAVLLLMADQPLVTAEHLNALIVAGQSGEIAISEYAGVRGPPALFPSQCFDGLMNIKGDKGARALLNDTRIPVNGIGFDAAGVDIDTPEDLARLAAFRT